MARAVKPKKSAYRANLEHLYDLTKKSRSGLKRASKQGLSAEDRQQAEKLDKVLVRRAQRLSERIKRAKQAGL